MQQEKIVKSSQLTALTEDRMSPESLSCDLKRSPGEDMALTLSLEMLKEKCKARKCTKLLHHCTSAIKNRA